MVIFVISGFLCRSLSFCFMVLSPFLMQTPVFILHTKKSWVVFTRRPLPLAPWKWEVVWLSKDDNCMFFPQNSSNQPFWLLLFLPNFMNEPVVAQAFRSFSYFVVVVVVFYFNNVNRHSIWSVMSYTIFQRAISMIFKFNEWTNNNNKRNVLRINRHTHAIKNEAIQSVSLQQHFRLAALRISIHFCLALSLSLYSTVCHVCVCVCAMPNTQK